MPGPESFSGNIRTLCQDAQSRIMRLQQATNTQVGMTSSMRARWFDELRSIAQCFVAAQQSSAKLEGAANTEREQLKGALKSALDELEAVKVQRDAAELEATYLKDYLDGFTGRLPNKEDTPPSHFDRQGYCTQNLSHAESTDILHQLPKAVEDMPLSPQMENSSLALQARSNTNRGYYSSHSRFFRQPKVAQSDSSQYSTSGQNTPDIYSGLSRGNFSQTPGVSRGPFPAPAVSRQTTENNGSSSQTLATSIHQYPKSLGQGRPVEPMRTHTFNASHHRVSRAQTSTPSSDLVLVNKPNLGEFLPGVTPMAGTTDEDRVIAIFGVFNAIRLWVKKYCASPSEGSVSGLGSTNPQLWDYVLNITYPNNRHNAASHATFLLTNQTTRCFFIARMVIQYVAERLWSPEAWEGHDRRMTEILVGIKKKLDPKYGYDGALQHHERCALVEMRSKVIYDLISRPGWINTEASRIDKTLEHFKGLVGPMLSSGGIDFQAALEELRGISRTTLRLSAVLNTCSLSFQYQFNECGIKFSEQSHRALNSTSTGRELQAQQWRVMCVVTPGITYRNDAGVSVDPRLLAKANVMVMQ